MLGASTCPGGDAVVMTRKRQSDGKAFVRDPTRLALFPSATHRVAVCGGGDPGPDDPVDLYAATAPCRPLVPEALPGDRVTTVLGRTSRGRVSYQQPGRQLTPRSPAPPPAQQHVAW